MPSTPLSPPSVNHWQTSRFDLELTQPLVMGIVNVTPDSFSDGGLHAETSQALRHAEQLLREGADILDIGAESTRPGAVVVPLEQELARLEPLLREAVRWQVPISVDTYKPEVMQVCLDWGVDIVNDIWALRQPGAQQVVAAHPRCGVCLMHMHRDPQTMQVQPMTGDVLFEVDAFLRDRVNALLDLGVSASRVVLDPGIGFGKTVAQNFQILARQSDLLHLGFPILAGWSRKSALGAALAQDGLVPEPAQRQVASVAAALMAVERGASVLRVHDVKYTVDALKIWLAMHQQTSA
ncbi:dihydropteroate synthase [Limnohabitans planktonicus]|uniref:Dihydropteroate synthase n=1 Tax=Limnohabitans planktonicus II-D5 TaxID=1293045 RepID=A0A2T7UH56_9BURK|nr:dihydropteroate synthase [Limnohabitans planktonicus]PVE43994.1 dihydropteroate synthase [Limnohabitans planktonicus II-D5]|eukprot:gene29113-36105_t